MADDIDALIEECRRIAERQTRTILGITGAPAAGKSTLAERIVTAIGPELAALAPMDGFHLSNDVLRAHGSLARKGSIDTFDDAGYASLISRIRHQSDGEVIFAPRFERSLEEPIAGGLEIRAHHRLVVTEGNYLLAESGFWPRARELMNVVWFVDVAQDVRIDRLIERHMRFGRDRAQAQERSLGTDEVNAVFIASSRHHADRIVRPA